MRNNLFKCTNCDKILIAEECDSHRCKPSTKGWKDIEIAWYSIVRDMVGREVLFAKGWDGVSYNMTVIPKSNGRLHPFISDDKVTEPCRIRMYRREICYKLH